MPRRVRALLAATLLALATLAVAQIDDRARTFLESLDDNFDIDVTSLQQTVATTTYMPDGSAITMNVETIVDYVGRRARMTSQIAPGMDSVTLYKDGTVTMSMSGVPLDIPSTPEMAQSLEALFEPPVWPGFEEGDVATYDGHVSYGDILAGEQVSYTTKHTLVAGEEPANYTTRFVFASDGAVLGYIIESEGVEPLLMVYDEPALTGYLAGFDANLYLREGDGWRLTSRMEFIDYRVNEPIDERAFE